MSDLGSTIEERIAGWDGHVELAIFGTREPDAIARTVDAFCTRHLGQPIGRYIFYRSSIASVHGVELEDGRRFVVRAHQPDVARDHLEQTTDLQRRLALDGFPCPRPLTGPQALGHGLAVAEEELTRGRWFDGHDPAFRASMARSLAELVGRCRSLMPHGRGLRLDVFLSLPGDQLWPIPHAAMFDFEATTAGAERIDAVAAAARVVLDGASTREMVIGHTDWRAENLRFDGRSICAVYDWQSLARTLEPALAGGVAHAFCSDWNQPPRSTQAPTLDEARAFVSEYEVASGNAFDREDRRLLGAAFAYATAYTARCGHAVDPKATTEEGQGFRTLVHDHGVALIDAFVEPEPPPGQPA